MWIVSVWDAKGELVQRIPFKTGEITFGRDPACTVVLTAPAVGKVSPIGGRHARIEDCDATRLVFTDEGAPGGSRLNGQKIDGAVFLEHGKQIELPGYRIGVEREAGLAAPAPPRPAVAAAPAPTADDDPIARELDRQMKSIQAHREEVQKAQESRKSKVDLGWEQAVESLRRLQQRLAQEPRVQHFTISRDGKEVAVKLAAPSEKQGYRYFLLTRLHPDGRYPELDTVWLREFGRDDKNFPDPQKALTELVQRIAGTLA